MPTTASSSSTRPRGDAGRSGCVQIFLRDPHWRTVPPAETLMAEFGLTRAQANVCLRLLRDQSPEQIAAELGVSVNTMCAQLKAAMQKTGVHRVAQLVRRLAIALPATDENI